MLKSSFLQDPGYTNRSKVHAACCIMYLFLMSKESKVVHTVYIHSMAFMSTESKVNLNNNVDSNAKSLNYMKIE